MSTVTQSVKKTIFYSICLQLMMLAGAISIIFLLKGVRNSFSALAGGLAYFVPTLLFTWLIVKRTDPRKPAQFLVAFWAGEAGKLLLCGSLFLLVVLFLPVQLLYALFGLIITIITFWIASIQSVLRRTVG